MAATNPRIKLPDAIRAGDVIEVKTLVTHIMETGNRKDRDGKTVPRDIVNAFVAKFDGQEVFRAEFGPGVSANPYVSFMMRVAKPGALEVTWIDDHSQTTTASALIKFAE